MNAIIEGMAEIKAHEITTLDLRNLKSAPADFFVICHGESVKQTEAIADSIDETVKKMTGENPIHVEGQTNAEWILLDYFNVVVHVFQKEKRAFYGIEDLWADAVVSQIN
ncbi:MAG: ribosome silencing factor [Bacteroidetes bacterium]|nr:ribosome silencing factor [Bacteroidota bacterium]